MHILHRIALGMYEEKDNEIIPQQKPNKDLSKKYCEILFKEDGLSSIVKMASDELASLEELGKK